MARKPPALARELLRNFPKRRARNSRRTRKGSKGAGAKATGSSAQRGGREPRGQVESAAPAGEVG